VGTAKLETILNSIREVIALVWTDAGRFVKLRLVTVMALVAAASVLTALGPVALKLIIDRFTHQTKSAAVSIIVLVGLYGLSQWSARAVGALWGFLYARAERRMFRTLSERMFAHLMRLPLRFHLDRQTGAINQILDNGLQGYQMIAHHLVFTFLPVTGELGTIILVLSHMTHPPFVALFCGALICYAIAFAYAAITLAKAAKAAAAARVDANAAMTDGLLNYETVKFFSAEETLQERVSRALSRTEIQWVRFFRRYALNGLAVGSVFGTFLFGTVAYSSREVAAGRMTVGDFVLVNTYMLQMVRPVEMLGYAMQELSQGVAMLEKLLALFRETPEPQLSTNPIASSGPGRLEFDNVALSYRPERTVLADISFKISPGKTLGIVGASGSGKSTIVRLLVRLLEPTRGDIMLDGIPIAKLSLASLRESIAVVPQDTVLFNDTIGYNIGFGKAHSTAEEIKLAAKLAHLHDFVMSLPDGYDTPVGERGVKLSGGERQRVAIARAAIKRPKIYVFDEATSSLDSKTEREILRNLREIARVSTTVVIAHRLSTVVHADEIIVLENGVLAERGTHSSLVRRNGHYAALWEAQQHESVTPAA
jgi:ABC-type transport system involved in Fe-S cluster assembly fused permease/ATPase subunit